jgi:hypothetical protein
MGTINHNAIIAVTCDSNLADNFQKWVNTLLQQDLIIKAGSWENGYQTFVVVPDGSKEGGLESNNGDTLRNKVIERLKKDNYEDGSSPWDWIEVGFGEYGQKVLQGNCKNNEDFKCK